MPAVSRVAGQEDGTKQIVTPTVGTVTERVQIEKG